MRETTCFIPGREDTELLGASATRCWASVDPTAPQWVKDWIIEKRQAMLAGIETRSIDQRHAGLRRGRVESRTVVSPRPTNNRERDAACEKAWREFCANNSPDGSRQRRLSLFNSLL